MEELEQVRSSFVSIIRNHGYNMDDVWMGEVPSGVLVEALADCGLFIEEEDDGGER